MSEIKGFDLSRLTQDENFGFHSFAIVEFEKCKDSKITEFVNNYKVKYNVFDGSMKVSGGENVLPMMSPASTRSVTMPTED